MDPQISSQAPLDRLRAEHRVIERVLDVLRRLTARSEQCERLETAPLLRCVEFFRHYADACHHAKEESLLFPLLESLGIPREGGPIGVMLHEHRIARQLTSDMNAALGDSAADERAASARFCPAARRYVELLVSHIQKEDNVLFVIADRVMSGGDQAQLAGKFDVVDAGLFGGKRREEFEQMADELERQWPPRSRD